MTNPRQTLESALAARYRIERELGAGGMATVFLARDLKHDRDVAVKVLHDELTTAVGVERFLREISIVAKLQHPNILTLIDSGELSDTVTGDRFVYYVMPRVDGETLGDRLARDGALPVSDALRLLRDIVDGVASAHRHGIIHRDLKPDNILLSEQHALVVDFGVAKAVSEAGDNARLTATGTSVGTPAYMSPEQAACEPVDNRADIYALGVLAYEMLVGRPPFSGSAHAVLSAHLLTAPGALSTRERPIPADVERVVLKCLAKDPAARFADADALLAAIDDLSRGEAAPKGATRFVTPIVAAAAVMVIAYATYAARSSRVPSDRGQAATEILRLIDAGDNDSAFAVAQRARARAPDDSLLRSLWPRFTRSLSFVTQPSGATVSRARFDDTSHWEVLGVTPLTHVSVPAAVDRYVISKPGFRTVKLLAGGMPHVTSPPVPAKFQLEALSAPDTDMVRIPGGEARGDMEGLAGMQPLKLADFHLDGHEVTNRQYKRFVDAGGYTRRELWTEAFVRDGRRIDWKEAIALLTDKTGRPGPSTWEAGDIPRGQEDFPVGGLSWYEASAYARFIGKSLPTLYHWNQAAGTNTAAHVSLGSTFAATGPTRGNNSAGMSPFGTFDMAGNVREWCLNDDGSGKRYILGGGWSDPVYAFLDAYAQLPFDRSEINGVRLARYASDDSSMSAARAPLRRVFRDYRRERPVNDATFATYRALFDYDHTPLRPRVESRDSTDSDWIRERISIDAAYGGGKMALMLYLPRRTAPPYQTVVYFPPGNGMHKAKSDDVDARWADFLMKNGRAFAFPVYAGTNERSDALTSDKPDSTIFWRDHVIMWGKDMRRAIDYLETRADIDTTRFAYYGLSFGGRVGSVMLAIEPRFKAAVLQVAGLAMEAQRPEADPFNYLPHVTTPVLMLNGKYDHMFPLESSQKPYFALLGTVADRKRQFIYEGGHVVPRTQLIAESLAWLDRYLGEVKRQ